MSDMVKCPRCSELNSPDASFCVSCGSSLPSSSAPRAYEEYTRPSGSTIDDPSIIKLSGGSAPAAGAPGGIRGSKSWLGACLGLVAVYIIFTLFGSGAAWVSIINHFEIDDPDILRFLFLGPTSGSDLWDMMRRAFPGVLLVVFPLLACIFHYSNKKIPAAIFAVLGLSASVPGVIAFTDFGIWISLGWAFGAVASLLLLIAILSDRSAKTCGYIILGLGALSLILTFLLSFCEIQHNWRTDEYKIAWEGSEYWNISSEYHRDELQRLEIEIPFFINSSVSRGLGDHYRYRYFFSYAASTGIPLSQAILCFLMGAGCLAGASWPARRSPLPVRSAKASGSSASAPAYKIATNRSLLKMLLLGILTCGIYPMIISYYMCEDINLIASRHDGRRTMHPVAASLLGFITCGIYLLVWQHGLCNRIRDELDRRNISYRFSASTFWLWCILGSLILIGPLVFTHKYCAAMNYLAEDYNQNG